MIRRAMCVALMGALSQMVVACGDDDDDAATGGKGGGSGKGGASASSGAGGDDGGPLGGKASGGTVGNGGTSTTGGSSGGSAGSGGDGGDFPIGGSAGSGGTAGGTAGASAGSGPEGGSGGAGGGVTAGDGAGGEAGGAGGAQSVRFQQVTALLTSRCAGCHNGGDDKVELAFDDELYDRLTTPLPTGTRTCVGETLVVADNPASSFILEKISPNPSCGNRMPNGCGTEERPCLTDEEVALISSWINAGAPE